MQDYWVVIVSQVQHGRITTTQRHYLTRMRHKGSPSDALRRAQAVYGMDVILERA